MRSRVDLNFAPIIAIELGEESEDLSYRGIPDTRCRRIPDKDIGGSLVYNVFIEKDHGHRPNSQAPTYAKENAS